MKTPTWATTIGIIMIVLGGCSVMNDIKSVTLPSDLEKAMTIMKKEKGKAKLNKQDSTTMAVIDSLETEDRDPEEDSISFAGGKKQSVEQFLELTDFTKTWIVRFGYIGLFSAVLYILGGVFLLVRRRFSIKLVYAVLGISILCSGAQAAVLTSSSSSGIIALSTGLGQVLGIIVDIILLAVIFTQDKEAYAPQNLS
jgi:uncharacterized membrane protein HdeD (DUF308 family)